MINWPEKKEKLKQIFITLKDKDLLMEEDKMDEVLSRLETKLGKSKEALRKLISKL
ncbi:hypothetical protein JKA74_16825 [Marivirga sp. S37H4]|uniref:General stress protein CsbD n=1 Tax=Marivirga aurantiaca TaxID=2802615 RepID=A0A935CBC8_9BACT|nr:hypothetical protein [Marivirga aurantiaca]MBK6266712.1 hypothetical protein [Marivirga aurantiaca]